MEDIGILRRSAGRSFLGRWPTPKLIVLWCLLVFTFTAGGYYTAGTQVQGASFMQHAAIESAILSGGLGFGIATCLIGGLWTLASVHIGRFGKGAAILSLAASSFVSAMATRYVIQAVANSFPPDAFILTGESSMGIVFVWGYVIIIAAIGFIVFTGVVIFMRRAPRHSQPQHKHSTSS
jgi:hypothetical protein